MPNEPTVVRLTPALLAEVATLDKSLMDSNGRIKLLSAWCYEQINPVALRVWCMQNARYGIPTVELVTWLKERIAGRPAIEIGCGNGDLGYHLGIPETDNNSQQDPLINEYYRLMGQAATKPGPGVEKIDGNAAIEKYSPLVVIGSWITQKHKMDGRDGSVYGVDEEEILSRVQTYIHVGNRLIHRDKRIFANPHECITANWLISRAENPKANALWIWGS